MLQYNSQYTQSFSSVFYVIIYKNKKLYCFSIYFSIQLLIILNLI